MARNTPIMLDRLRHLRYPLSTVWDMDFLVVGGFSALLMKNIDRQFITFLLWSGLKWEDPALTIPETEKIIDEYAKDKNGEILTICTRELFECGWYNSPDPEQARTHHGDGGRAIPTRDLILSFERAGQYYRMPREEVWTATPKELNSFIEVQAQRDKEPLFRMGMICAAIFNTSMLKKAGGDEWRWDDFIPKTLDDIRQTPEEMSRVLGGL